MAAPTYNSTITIDNRLATVLTRASVTPDQSAPAITAPATIAGGAVADITSIAATAATGTGGKVEYYTTDAGQNRVYIRITFTCNSNNSTVSVDSTSQTISAVSAQQSPSRPLNATITTAAI